MSEPPLDRPLHGAHILVVEDDPIIAMNLSDILATAGALIIGPASNLDQAFQLAEKDSLSAAVLDVRLERGDTLPLANQLLTRRIPFLFQTSDPRLVAGLYPGVQVLHKPFQSEQLVAALVALLGHS